MRREREVERRPVIERIHIHCEPAAARMRQMRADIDAAGSADEEIRGLQSEAITLQRGAITDHNPDRTFGIGRVAGTVGAAEAAHAGAQTECGKRRRRLENEAEIAAMASARKPLQAG